MNKAPITGGGTLISLIGGFCIIIGLVILFLSSEYNFQFFAQTFGFIIVGIILLKWAIQRDKPNERELKKWNEANEITSVGSWAQASFVFRIRSIFLEAGSNLEEAEDLTRIAVKILKEGSRGDWSQTSSDELIKVIQAAKTLKGKQ